MVVVQSVGGRGQVALRVTGSPGFVLLLLLVPTHEYCGRTGTNHHLDVQLLVRSHIQLLLGVADARPRVRVVVSYHVGGLGGVIAGVHGLVDDLEGADGAVVVVRVDAVRHPLEELVRALVVVLSVEARRTHTVPRVLLVRELRAGTSMQVHDHVDARIRAPSDEPVEVG